MNKILISVVIATHNDEKFIWEAIESILNQTFNNFELIIVNDFSNDNTLNILKKYQDIDNRIIIINNKNNIWAALSRNKWIKIAKWKYIAILDWDDIALLKRLEIQYNFLENNKCYFLLWTDRFFITEEWKKIDREYNYFCWNIWKILLKKSAINNPSVMFRNDRKTFYRKKIIFSHDYDLWLRLYSEWKKMFNLNEKLIYYRFNNNSITSKNFIKQQLFANASLEFYYQRIKNNWVDNYNDFDNKKIMLSRIESLDNKNIFWKYLSRLFFNDLNFYNYKKYYKIYYNKFWIDKYFIHYILSFFSPKIILFFRKKFLRF